MVKEKLKRIAMVVIVFLALGVVGNLVQYLANLDSKPEAEEAVPATEATEPVKVWGGITEIPADRVRNIKIEWGSGSITVATADVEQIQVRETGGKKDLNYMVKDDSLLIRYSGNELMSLFAIHSKKGKDLEVLIPESWQGGTVEFEAVNAGVTVRGLQAQYLEHDGVSGGLTAENCRFDTAAIRSVSGDVRYSGLVQELTCEGVSGQCTLEMAEQPRSLTLKGLKGNVQILLPENAGFTAEADSLGTAFHSDFEGTATEEQFRAGDGSCRITLDDVSGPVSVRKAS